MKYLLNKLENHICTLTINRPDQYNALNVNVLKELDNCLDWILNETDARVIIITGQGDKAFIAGADIQSMQNMDKIQANKFSKIGQELTLRIQNFTIPIIAAVNGFALGGGCEFAMACHIRYASENAVFGQPEVSLGLIAGWGGTQRLPDLVGRGIALEILLSGTNISAERAESIGLINKVVKKENLISSAEKLAHSIIQNSPIAITSTLKVVNVDNKLSLKERLNFENNEFGKLFTTDDTKEGLTAFIEKRKPKFKGK